MQQFSSEAIETHSVMEQIRVCASCGNWPLCLYISSVIYCTLNSSKSSVLEFTRRLPWTRATLNKGPSAQSFSCVMLSLHSFSQWHILPIHFHLNHRKLLSFLLTSATDSVPTRQSEKNLPLECNCNRVKVCIWSIVRSSKSCFFCWLLLYPESNVYLTGVVAF